MKNFIFFLAVILYFSSCNNEDENIQNQLIGDWVYSSTFSNYESQQLNGIKEPPPPPLLNSEGKMGFTILDKDSCLYKRGFFSFNLDRTTFENITQYLGNKTTYKVEKKAFRVYDLTRKRWIESKIHSIKNDSLILEVSDSVYSIYVKNKNENYDLNLVDRIIVSSTGCYGSCPISDVSNSSDGSVIYNGLEYNTIQGIYESKISRYEYEQILRSFLKTDFLNLDDRYIATHTDDECISVTFIKNNTIIKTIMGVSHQEVLSKHIHLLGTYIKN